MSACFRVASLLLLVLLPVVASAQDTSQNQPPTVSAGESGADSGKDSPQRKRQPETILEFAIAGGWMMVILLVCSVVWMGFFLERLITLRRKKVIPAELVSGLRSLLDTKPFDTGKALSVVAAHPSPAATVLKAAIERLHLPLEKIEKGVQNAASQEVFGLRNNLWIFAIMSTAARLLGLLGTVIGLVQTFREVAISGLGAGATLAPGIYEALITTVGGLATAIPALVIYYWLQARVDAYVHEIDRVVVEIVDASGASTS